MEPLYIRYYEAYFSGKFLAEKHPTLSHPRGITPDG